MHFCIDVREACSVRKTGKGQWTRCFVDALLQRKHTLTLISDTPLPLHWQQSHLDDPQRIRVRLFPSGIRWHLRCAFWLYFASDIDVYISPVSYIIPFLVGRRVRIVPVIHDLIAFRDATHEKRATRIERWMLPRTIRTAVHICTVSEATKRDLCDHFPRLNPQNVSVILAAATDDAPISRKTDGTSILSIGTLCPRKNQLRLIEAYAALPSAVRASHSLLLVGGKGWYDDVIIRRAREVPGVLWLGFCSDDEVRTLLAAACIFVYPSLYEGFGLPVLDAMRAGVPVLCSDRGSIAEVAGDAAELTDPENVDQLRDGLLRLVSNSQLRQKLSIAGPKQAALYSWKRTVDLFLTAVENLSA